MKKAIIDVVTFDVADIIQTSVIGNTGYFWLSGANAYRFNDKAKEYGLYDGHNISLETSYYNPFERKIIDLNNSDSQFVKYTQRGYIKNGNSYAWIPEGEFYSSVPSNEMSSYYSNLNGSNFAEILDWLNSGIQN